LSAGPFITPTTIDASAAAAAAAAGAGGARASATALTASQGQLAELHGALCLVHAREPKLCGFPKNSPQFR